MFCLLFYNPPIRDILLLLFKAGKGIESAAENAFNPYATRILRFVAIIPSGHTFATLSLQSHVDPKTLSEALGHATVAFTLDVYGHSNEDMKQEAADRLEQLICQY